MFCKLYSMHCYLLFSFSRSNRFSTWAVWLLWARVSTNTIWKCYVNQGRQSYIRTNFWYSDYIWWPWPKNKSCYTSTVTPSELLWLCYQYSWSYHHYSALSTPPEWNYFYTLSIPRQLGWRNWRFSSKYWFNRGSIRHFSVAIIYCSTTSNASCLSNYTNQDTGYWL